MMVQDASASGDSASIPGKLWNGVSTAAGYVPWWGWFGLGVAAAYGSPIAYRWVKHQAGAKLRAKLGVG